MRRMLPKLLVLLTAAAVMCCAFAAAAHAALTAQPGEELTLTVPLGKQNSVNVAITSSRPDVAAITDVAFTGTLTGTVSLGRVNVFSAEADDCSLTVRIRVAEDAPAGSASSIAVNGFVRTGDYDPAEFHWTSLVEIPIPAQTEPENDSGGDPAGDTGGGEAEAPAGNDPAGDGGSSSGTAPTRPSGGWSSGSGGTPAGQSGQSGQSGPEPGLTQAEAELEAERQVLRRQLAIVSALRPEDYSLASWNALEQAAEEARQAEKAEDPELLRAAADGLEKSLGYLERMDYARVTGIIAGAELILDGSLASDGTDELKDIAERAKALYGLRDQRELDAAAESLAEELSGLMEELSRRREEEQAKTPDPPADNEQADIRAGERQPQQEQEGPIVTPEERRSAPGIDTRVLLGIVAVLVLAALIAGVITIRRARKVKTERDTTPVVDYDISDDE